MNFFMSSLHYIIISEISRIGDFQISSPQVSNTKIFSLNPRLLILSYSNSSSEILSITLKCTEKDSDSLLKLININIPYDSIHEDKERFQKTFRFENSNKEDSELILEFVHSNPHRYFSKSAKNLTNFKNEKNIDLIKNGKANLKFKDIFIIGHRGFGGNYYTQKYLENTIPSFQAAFEKGADFVECDVQLTKDDIPVVIHNNKYNEKDISEYTSDEFIKLGLSTQYKVKFSTYKKLLRTLPKDRKLDVEIKVKWDEFYDRNHLVNRVLDVTYKYNYHKLFFCTFDPIIAAITALRQKTYNVFLLLHDPSSNSVNYYNPLFKYCGVKGYIINSPNLLQYPVHSKEIISNGFMLMSWGKSNLQRDTLLEQIKIGVRGFVTDDVEITSNLINDIANTNSI